MESRAVVKSFLHFLAVALGIPVALLAFTAVLLCCCGWGLCDWIKRKASR